MKKMFKVAVILVALLALVVSCASSDGAKKSSASSAGGGAKITLKAKDAELVTSKEMTFEDGNQNIGWWSDLGDQAKWNLEVATPGTYMVVITFSCTASQPGSVVKVMVGDKELEWTVGNTTDWNSFKKAEIGTVDLKAGTVPVMMQAKSIKVRFVANVTRVDFVQQ
ncbi:MAG: hypothetical protein JW874_04020 [Spirochaetales bacterium]|nr:hypothetical protein [Spirochaetales bacterium]